jgi:putative ABC transport system ATP-binding protein
LALECQYGIVRSAKAHPHWAASWTAKRMIGVKPLASTEVLSSDDASVAPTEQPVLVLDGLARAYGARTVVAIPSWTVAAGQHSLILGPSGSGKSTLLHLIAGLLRPSRGRVVIAGQDLAMLTPAELDAFRGRMIGIVLQRLHLIPALTVRDNLRLARMFARLPPNATRIDALITDLGLGPLGGPGPALRSQGEGLLRRGRA